MANQVSKQPAIAELGEHRRAVHNRDREPRMSVPRGTLAAGLFYADTKTKGVCPECPVVHMIFHLAEFAESSAMKGLPTNCSTWNRRLIHASAPISGVAKALATTISSIFEGW